jgi:predicted ABC-type ATPase
VIAGPNGAGKSTIAPDLLRGKLAVSEFVNADTIARGLSAFAPEDVAFAAGRIMLDRLHDLSRRRADFAFETTLATLSFAPWLRELVAKGYSFHLLFISLVNPGVAVQRVRSRVRLGGHDVPEATIRRRFGRGLRNFFQLYLPLATTWRVYDNSAVGSLKLIASGRVKGPTRILDAKAWKDILDAATA